MSAGAALGHAIHHEAARHAQRAQRVVQLADVLSMSAADGPTVELQESRHVIQPDEILLTQWVRSYQAGVGIKRGDVLLMTRKDAGGSLVWVATDVISTSALPSADARIASLETSRAADEADITSLEASRTADEARLAALEGAKLLNVQSKNGASESYSGLLSNAGQSPLDNGAGGSMSITYTPPVDAWWDVSGLIGIVVAGTAAYHYIYGGLLLSAPGPTTDVDGVSGAYALVTQHASVNLYEARAVSRVMKLAADSSYTLNLMLFGGDGGGTWQYYRGPQQLNISARAYAR